MRLSVALALASVPLLAPAAPTIAGCPVFPADNVWNTPVDTLPVNASSSSWVSSIGSTTALHPDFGTSYLGTPIGISFVTVPSTQPVVPLTFQYAGESDPGPYPIPPNAPIEGGSTSTGDRHVLVLRTGTCDLFELYDAFPQNGGISWNAGSGARFDLTKNGMRPEGWTSADAAGLPILPGLVRYDEVAAGKIEHALRFTAQHTRDQHIWPATHDASSLTGVQYPPLGARFRLKASFDTSPYPAAMQPVLAALKKYGMILADNGSNWFLSGEHNDAWNDSVIGALKQIKGSDFEAVDTSGMQISPTSSQALQPVPGVPAPPPPAPLPPPPAPAPVVKAHNFDLNADGNADLVFQHADGNVEVRLMQGTAAIGSATFVPSAPGSIVTTTGDFNGDGKVDLLFARNDGAVEMWLMDGTSRTNVTTLRPVASGWQVVHVGDFNADGKSDILWRNANGAVELWLMNGSSVASSASLMPAGSAWVPQLVGDFNGDGKTDIVWRASNGSVSMWLMNGTAVLDRGALLGSGSTLSPIRVGDFNGDHKSDLVFQDTNGSVQVWLMNGRTATSTGVVMGPNTQWTVSHVADFNGDGFGDFVWTAKDGTAAVWLTNGSAVTQRVTEMQAGTGWSPSVVEDYNHDGKSDLVWSSSNGAVGVWVMNGTSVSSRSSLESAGSTNKVVPVQFQR